MSNLPATKASVEQRLGDTIGKRHVEFAGDGGQYRRRQVLDDRILDPD
jgi:hypothetical protein